MEHTWNFRPVQGGLPRSPPFPPANFSMDFRHPHPLPGYENPQQPVFQRPFFDPPGHFRHDDRLLGQPGYHSGGPPAMPGFEHRPGPMGFVRPEFRVNPAHVGGHFPEQRRWDNAQVRGGITDPSSWNSFSGPNLDRRSLNDGHGNHPTFGGTSTPSVDRWNEKTQTACEGFDNRVSNTGNWGSSGYAGTFGDDRGAPVVGRGFEEQRLVENGTVYKRPRLENGSMVEYNEYGHPSLANAGKRSLEDERLSNLIRDHGGYSGPIGQTRFQEQPTSPYPLDGSFDAMSFQGRPHLPEGAQNRWSGVDQLRESSMNGARRGLDMEHQRPFRNEFPAILQPQLGSSVQHGVGPSQPDLGSGNYGSHAAAGNPQANDHPERGVMQSQDLYHRDQISHDSDKLASGYSKDRENHFLSQQMLPQTLTLQPQTRKRLDSSGHVNQRMLDHTDQNQDRAVSHQEQGSSNRQDQFFLPPSKQGFSKIDPQMSQFTSDHDSYCSRVDMASNNPHLPPPDNSFGIRHTSQQLRDGHINYHTVETGKQQHPRHVVGTPNESNGQQDMTLPPENCRRNFGQSNENYFFPEIGPGSHLRNRQQMSQPLLGALPLAGEPPYPPSHENQVTPSPLTALKYPGISSTSSVLPSSVAIPGHALPEARPPAQGCHASLPTIAFPQEGFLETQFLHPTEVQPFSLKKTPGAKPTVVDATHLFMPPHRTTRPDHIVIILRGLPGSGKSYLAKALRDLEVSNGGNAPRIHSMDDYFMTEVEKVEESESSKTSGAVKGKRIITKKVMEYCYEPEMEEAYRASMLKAFKKTLEDGIFKFVIVDDRNLRVADFAQFWATAKRSGYEVYILEATYRDIAGCAARNVHGFTYEDIQKMADKWEHTPPLYLQLNTQSLFHGDDLNDQGIAEVEMDMEEVNCSTEEPLEKNDEKLIKNPDSPSPDYEYERDRSGIGQRWQAEISDSLQEVKETEKSKWSNNMDEVADVVKPPKKASQTALSGLIQAYGKGDKSLRWGDHDGRSGFAIGVGKKSKSLIIGPGAGYNLDSNPLPEETASESDHSSSGESKRRTVFLEHLRAERESFRAVFDRRRQRIGGLDLEDD